MSNGSIKQTSRKSITTSSDHPITAVIHHYVKPGSESEYEEWANRISSVSKQFPGRMNLNIIKPSGKDKNYTLVLHFIDVSSLNNWFGSKERAKLVHEAQQLFAQPENVEVKTGLELWFEQPASPPGPAKRWKQVLLIFTALYPTNVIIQEILSPLFKKPIYSNIFVRNLAGLITIVLLVYVILPRYSRLISKWLYK